MKKYITVMNKWLITVTDLMKNILIFAIISGLLFNDPFGTIGVITKLISKKSNKMSKAAKRHMRKSQ